MAQSESGHTYYGQGTDGPKVEQQTYLDENSLLFVLIMKNSECTLYSMLYLYPVQSVQYLLCTVLYPLSPVLSA